MATARKSASKAKIKNLPTRQFEVDELEYPFKSNWFEREGSFLHYIDQGKGAPVLMLHGNPTWSFLYRHVIKDVEDCCRAIAPDYPGFGFSQHPTGYGYTPQEHSEWIKALIAKLKLKDIILVVQDWGGPIGMSIATDDPDNIRGLVICNTWSWPPDMSARIFSGLMGGFVGEYLHKEYNFFAKVIVPAGIAKNTRQTDGILKAYTHPLATPESRTGTAVFPRAITESADWLADIEEKLGLLKGKPVEMVWAMKDPAFGSDKYIRKWTHIFPNANVKKAKDASHYLQEDCPGLISDAIRRVVERRV